MKTSQLKLNPKNPRIIKDEKFKKLVNSIKDFPEMMEKRPLVCVTDEDGKIYPLGGNMRLKAIKELKMKEIPDSWIVYADNWTKEQRDEFTIKDNVSFGDWELEVLKIDWDPDLLTDWALELKPIDDDYFEIQDKEEKTNLEPKASDDEYSVYELIMKHENKTLLIMTLNKIKLDQGFEKQEDAIMHLVKSYI